MHTQASTQNNVKAIAGRVRGTNGVADGRVGGASKLPGRIVRTGDVGRGETYVREV